MPDSTESDERMARELHAEALISPSARFFRLLRARLAEVRAERDAELALDRAIVEAADTYITFTSDIEPGPESDDAWDKLRRAVLKRRAAKQPTLEPHAPDQADKHRAQEHNDSVARAYCGGGFNDRCDADRRTVALLEAVREERDAEWSESMDPSCLAEFTPGTGAMLVAALQEANEAFKRELALTKSIVHAAALCPCDACALLRESRKSPSVEPDRARLLSLETGLQESEYEKPSETKTCLECGGKREVFSTTDSTSAWLPCPKCSIPVTTPGDPNV